MLFYIVQFSITLYLATGFPTPPFSFSSNLSPRVTTDEICDNALDDDNDGWIDLNDPDCDCPVIEPVSLIPNPSFEDMDCCPSNRSQLNCADTWIQASDPTTDYLHTCGWMGWIEFPPPLPFPDGEGIVGFRDGRVIQNNQEFNWKEYAGACLLGPLQANTAYRFEFHVGFVNNYSSPPINITFFGTTDCDNLPFGIGNQFFGCPTNGPGWVRLGSVRVNGIGWVQSQIDVNPTEDITAIAIGPDCPGVLTDRSLYYFFDNLVLAEQRAFDFAISEVEHPCEPDFTLKVPSNPDLSYQWYKDGIALVGETGPQLNAIRGEGNYQVRILGNGECNITRVYRHRVPVIRTILDRTICAEETMAFGEAQLSRSGEYVDTLQTVHHCDSIVVLHLEVLGLETDTVFATIFEGETYQVGHFKYGQAGQHDITLNSSAGCDSLVALILDFYQVFFPNVFSPNKDGINDIFTVFGGDDLKELELLKIFDRWGALVYEGKNLQPNSNEGWDGQFRGKSAGMGVYTYLASLLMDDGGSRQISGSVTLIR